MFSFNRLRVVLLTAALLGTLAPVEARTRKGDKLLAQGRLHEEKKEWDAAMEAYDKALAEEPGEIVYQMASQKARFQASQGHVDAGMKIRAQGMLEEALLEFQKAYALYPGSSIAEQELRRTQEMIQRERKKLEETGKESSPEQKALTPGEQMKKENQDRMRRMLAVPELKPLDSNRINLTLNGQTVKKLFETVGITAGINVLFDPEYTAPTKNQMDAHFENATLEEALDYLAVITKSYWKALSPNTIFVTNDNPNKRRDFAEMVAQTFYLSNVSGAQEIQEIVNAVRTVSELQRVVAYNAQNAIVVRGEADQVALAGKMIHDLDKPKSEVVVDIMVMEASTNFSRQLTTALASTGLNLPVNFTPRSSITVPTTNNNNNNNNNANNGLNSTPSTPTTSPIPLSQLSHLSSSDFSMSLPGALLQAVLSDTKTKTLQAPQIRTVDATKAEIKIGEREPTATGSFQPGIGGVGINPLVNTQFTYIDVGVNVTLQTRVHDNMDVTMHIDLDVSTVAGHVNLGGIDQPIIGQRKVSQDVRMHQGEVALLGGLINLQDTKQITGIPGLSSIPLLRRLFSGESVDHQRGELMIVLIPHVVRRPDLTAENLRALSVGNATTIKLGYAPKDDDTKPAAGAPPARAAAPNPAPAMVTPPAASTSTQPANPGLTPPATAPPSGGLTPPATAPPLAPPATTPPMANAQPGSGARVRFTPSQVDTNTSGTFTVAVSLEGGTDVGSAPLQVQFDPKVLRVNDVVRGDLFTSDGQQAVFTKNVLNESGMAAVQLSRMPGTSGVTGSGVLVTLTFEAIGKGPTTVTIPNLSVKNSQGQVIASGSPQLTVNVR